MQFVFANLFLLTLVLVGAGYALLSIWLLKLVSLHENLGVMLILFTCALIATYFTMKWVHRWIDRRRRR